MSANLTLERLSPVLKQEAPMRLNSNWFNNFIDNKIYLKIFKKNVREEKVFIKDCAEIFEEGKHKFLKQIYFTKCCNTIQLLPEKLWIVKINFSLSLSQIEGLFSEISINRTRKLAKKDWEEILSILVGDKIVHDSKKVDPKNSDWVRKLESLLEE